MAPPKVGYLLLPYMRLPNKIRVEVALAEIKMGMSKLENIPTEINGKKVIVKGCKKWGVVFLGNTLFTISEYPLIDLKSIETKEWKKSQHVLKADKENK